MEYPLTVDDIVQQTGINASTIRRYLREFSEFIPSMPINRKQTMYGQETIAIVTRISELYAIGKYTRDIMEVLRYEVPISVEVSRVVEMPESDETALMVQPDVHELQEQIDRIVALAESLVEKTLQIDEHEAEITALRQTLVDTRSQVAGCVDQLTAIERGIRNQAVDPRLDALTAEMRQTTALIQQQNATIAALTDEIQKRPTSLTGWVKQSLGWQ